MEWDMMDCDGMECDGWNVTDGMECDGWDGWLIDGIDGMGLNEMNVMMG